MKFAVPWKLCCLPLTNVQGSQNGRFVNLHNSLKFRNSQKKQKFQKNKQNNLITQNCCKSGSFLMIADPLWSCVMLLCGPLWYCRSSVVLCSAPLWVLCASFAVFSPAYMNLRHTVRYAEFSAGGPF